LERRHPAGIILSGTGFNINKNCRQDAGAPSNMKYIASIIFIVTLLVGSGCTSVKRVPMITEEEDQLLLELSKSRKDKNNKESYMTRTRNGKSMPGSLRPILK
jgi:hypothetical protein